MKFKFKYYWLLWLVPFVFIIWYYNSKIIDKPVRLLSYYGPRHSDKAKDTTFHTLSFFEFTNQYGEITNTDSVKGKIFVCEFFFTTCKSICPIMNSNLEKVYKTFEADSDFLILSHTVDPETDSVATLLQYANQHGVNDRKWLFLTGSKPDLYEVARKSYLLNAEEGDGGEEDFIHTQNFALIDKEQHIRGFYDGTKNEDIDKMIREINLLKKEYAYLAKISD